MLRSLGRSQHIVSVEEKNNYGPAEGSTKSRSYFQFPVIVFQILLKSNPRSSEEFKRDSNYVTMYL